MVVAAIMLMRSVDWLLKSRAWADGQSSGGNAGTEIRSRDEQRE
jgi:hypothetical protein